MIDTIKKKLPVGISDFKELIEGEYIFVDKSLFVRDIIEDGSKVILITRPRRFGKTLNLSMLYYFFNIEGENIFQNLAISEDVEFCKKYQNKYPVIFISFKDVKRDSFKEAYADICTVISKLYQAHRYLLDGDLLFENEKEIFNNIITRKATLEDIRTSLLNLSEHLLKKYGKAPILLIDEYDTPIQEAYLKNYYDEMIGLMRGIFGKGLKDNKYLSKGIVTGIAKIAQESLFSGINNFEAYSLLRRRYGQYFGFTEDEVIKLINETKQEVSLASVKEWYNGYQIYQYVLYNPWSIISCLNNYGELKPYWLHTSSNELIAKLLKQSKSIIKKTFEELLQGNNVIRPLSDNLIFAEIDANEDALWSLLLHAGYLNVLSSEFDDYQLMAKIAIPNKEVGFIYYKIISQWFTSTSDLDEYKLFVESLVTGKIDQFKEYLSLYIMQTGSYFDFNRRTTENIFHVFVLGLVVGLRKDYIIHSNKESGLGRFDVVFIPKDKKNNGILLEFKVAAKSKDLVNKAKEALEQIKDNKYLETFKQHEIKSTLCIGLAFCGKQVEAASENIIL